MLLIGVFLLLSLSITAVWIAFQQLLRQSPVFSGFINPQAVNVLNSFFFQYLLPFFLTFLVKMVRRRPMRCWPAMAVPGTRSDE